MSNEDARFPGCINFSREPGPWTLPQEALSYAPPHDVVHKYFFVGTAKEVAVRQIFFHTPLEQKEKDWVRVLREQYTGKLPPEMEPFLLRLCYYNWRKFGEKGWLAKSIAHVKEVMAWRAQYIPQLSDEDPVIMGDLERGVMYWAARDSALRPLLIIRLKRLPKNVSSERFKKLTVFCFEWAMRYLFVPGKVETCSVVFDVRGVSVHNFPMSALSDMTNTLTRQYPFRLDRMFIINDSLFIQTVWQIAKQFLTEVQQQKMNFLRSGYDKELLKLYAPHHLEKEFGGTRDEIKQFYPFPLVQGPFTPGEQTGPNQSAIPNCHRAVSQNTIRGKYWLDDEPPLVWGPEAPKVFAACGLPKPEHYERTEEERKAEDARAKAIARANVAAKAEAVAKAESEAAKAAAEAADKAQAVAEAYSAPAVTPSSFRPQPVEATKPSEQPSQSHPAEPSPHAAPSPRDQPQRQKTLSKENLEPSSSGSISIPPLPVLDLGDYVHDNDVQPTGFDEGGDTERAAVAQATAAEKQASLLAQQAAAFGPPTVPSTPVVSPLTPVGTPQGLEDDMMLKKYGGKNAGSSPDTAIQSTEGGGTDYRQAQPKRKRKKFPFCCCRQDATNVR